MRRILVLSILGVCACATAPAPASAPASVERAPAPTPIPVNEPTGLKPVGESLDGTVRAVAEPPKEPMVAAVASEKVVAPDPPTISFTFLLPYEHEEFDETTLRKHVWRDYPGAVVEVRETGDEFKVLIKGLSPEVVKREQDGWDCTWTEISHADILEYEEGVEAFDEEGYRIGLYVEDDEEDE